MDITKEDIWVSPYELTSSTGLNAISGRTSHPGVLIRVNNGFGCIHPWTELGDKSLPEQLESLKTGQATALVKQSLACAKLDGEARESGRSLFSDDPIPPSHWLFKEGDAMAGIAEQGFRTVKLKIGPDTSALQSQTNLIYKLQQENLRIRLDANDSLSFAEFTDWWKSLPEDVREAIEFVEDPVPWHWLDWSRLYHAGIPLAADRPVTYRLNPARWLIFKPAVISEMNFINESKNIAVTSYMDHPLGQMWAAYRAQKLSATSTNVGECGLLTHRCFERNAFSERIEEDGPVLKSPPGTGLGFNDELEKLPWKRLN